MGMRVRRIAILIDGAFFLKRLPKLVEPRFCDTPAATADSARHLCKRHVQRLTNLEGGSADGVWLDHVYRLFYYDARPFQGVSHHPVLNYRVEFAKSEVAAFRSELFAELRRKRKFALRLGHTHKEGEWQIAANLTKRLLKTRNWLDRMEQVFLHGQAPPNLTAKEEQELVKLISAWRELRHGDVRLGLRQKGVDMRIGLDIASITLKEQADTIVLVTGDSDFVPAAKLARREGIELLLDPLRQEVSDDLHEHVDGIVGVFPDPSTYSNPNAPET
ncbi:NYN domain-containing protein [Halorhodospira halophila]|uniref:NYN domain-containing protein n=2 Tax=Ectothiorhodospiraceae TaxID=72276 RepID=UPI001EE7B4F0|nr:NYN domain-containing protein [Halorhodospira halophila]